MTSIRRESVSLNVRVLAFVLAALPLLAFGCSPARPGLARGREVYKTCMPCHGADGTGNQRYHAPAIAGLPQWYVEAQLTKFKDGIRGAHPDDNEGALMRPMAKTLYRPGDIPSVAEYVATLRAVPQKGTLTLGDVAAGQERYAGLCATCHGMDGRGNKDLSAPAIAGQSDWYLYKQLQKFKSGMRGAHPQDVTGQQMAAMSSTLEDTTAMLNVVAFIRTLAK
jgi:cytochrome c oxidase subunit 2